ncbi:hypothetical protein HGM15179_010426 [Zosterops borbonicus]|uniref:Uncharacterized protein n=1 Tax=Zosterops borbonicus TaxID=364589 RepID=A0A8K1LK81_9PASS|nr:hypothetical protein HGM15179_010426 [Zosterops borbonicus]
MDLQPVSPQGILICAFKDNLTNYEIPPKVFLGGGQGGGGGEEGEEEGEEDEEEEEEGEEGEEEEEGEKGEEGEEGEEEAEAEEEEEEGPRQCPKPSMAHMNFGYEAILLVLQCRNVVINWNRTEWTGPCAVNKAKVEQIVVKSLEFHSEKGRGIHILEDRRVPLKNHNPNHEILHVLKLISS